jgi:hypothetical protein
MRSAKFVVIVLALVGLGVGFWWVTTTGVKRAPEPVAVEESEEPSAAEMWDAAPADSAVADSLTGGAID